MTVAAASIIQNIKWPRAAAEADETQSRAPANVITDQKQKLLHDRGEQANETK